MFGQMFRRKKLYEDLNEEIEQHIAERADELVAEGMNREEAQAAARRAFGNVTRVEEQGREAWQWPRPENVVGDARFALRKLRHGPGFAATAIATLALGIGANVVVFSVLNGFILRPLDVPDAKNLWQVSRGGNAGDAQSYPDYKDFRDRDGSFSGLLTYRFVGAGITIGKSTTRSWGYGASGNFFDVLGVEPELGRVFHAGDEHGLASAPYVVLSDSFWRREFGARRDVLGETVLLNQHPFTVIGVAPKGFRGTEVFFAPDYWIPIVNAEQVTGWSDLCCRDHVGVTIMGRLKPGVTTAQATASVNALAQQMAREDKKDDGLTLRLRRPGPAGNANDPTKKALLGIMLLAFLVLVATCANLASIFAARAADRSSELAVRMAIGASRWMVARQLLTEAVIIALAGGVVGSCVAQVLLSALSTSRVMGDFPTHFPITPDVRVYLMAIGLSLASGIFFGLLPSRQVWRTDVVQAIKSGYVPSESFRRFAFRDLLLTIQIVVCTFLVTASLVAVRSMVRAMRTPLGFEPDGVMLAQADLQTAGYTKANALPVQKQLLEAAQAMPGTTAAAVTDSVPFKGEGDWFVYRWGTTEFLPSHMAFAAPTFVTLPGYFRTAQVPLLAGRDFTWDDDAKAPRVAIVNQTFARMLYGKTPAVGQRFALWATAKYQVVGVAADGKTESVGEDPQPEMFIPMQQGIGEVMQTSTTVMVRSKLPEDQVAAMLQRTVSGVAPGAPWVVQPWSDAVMVSLLPSRMATEALGVMGLLAALLAVTGIFGMASYSVSRRMKEQGIRMALGAQRRQVMESILRRPVLLLVVGSAIGMGAGIAASQVMAYLISLATPRDPVVLGFVLLAMLLVGLAATWIPARRALRIDPARLLRE
ncbi:MAG: ABC transporter permease [Acidobacteriaceae bacterium]